jgi:cobalt-zinc-cadmium efflux system outer membrane protein
MSARRLLSLLSLVLVSGCLWPVREQTDHEVALQIAHPFDVAPELTSEPAVASRPDATAAAQPGSADEKQTRRPFPPTDVQTTEFLQPAEPRPAPTKRVDVTIPPLVPGSEVPRLQLPTEPAAKEAELRRIYPPLAPLPEEPKPLPGPGGRPYTLADLQRLAAENSPTLRQAASDVQAARGTVIAARAYPNPTVAFEQDPNNAALSPGEFGFYIDQVIKTAGKLKLASAAAMMDLANAELALKRARSDLATNVRNAYYNLVVAQESLRINRALAQFTDEIYRQQADVLLKAGVAAAHEPSALRSQAYNARMVYQQSTASYMFAWKQLVAIVGLRQLPLSEVAGRVDRLFPAYEYDATLARVLRNHTDVLTARNGIEKARYNLKLAQVTPIPDVDVHLTVTKESTLPPFTWVTGVQIAVPVPIWDQNKGPTMAAQAGLVRALEEPHRIETSITNNFTAAFANYKNNIVAVDYYRRYILPDQVRYYRGVYARRNADPNSAFGDLVQAQQTLASDVSAYLGLLGQLWSSVVTVADFLQTDDLFQQAQAKELPPLPELSDLPAWPCPHPAPASVVCIPSSPFSVTQNASNQAPWASNPAPGRAAVLPEVATIPTPKALPPLDTARPPRPSTPSANDSLFLTPPPVIPSLSGGS